MGVARNSQPKAELLQLERKYMLRYVRNCGEIMVDLIERVQADIRSNKESVRQNKKDSHFQMLPF